MKHTVSIKENHIFRRLYAKGKHTVSPVLAIYVRRNDLGRNRLGLTVGTKVGKAVTRNKVRRRMREAYRLQEKDLSVGWDIVVVARVRAAFVPYGEIERELCKGLKKLGVLQR